MKTVILALSGHEKDFKYGKLLDNLRFTPQIIWFKDMDGNKHLNDITEKNSNKERLSSDDIFDLILLHLMVPEEYCEVYFEKTCMITDEVIADEDDLKLVRECQAWFLDETVKDEKRKRRIKEVLKMSEYVPSIFLDYEEKGIEKEYIELKIVKVEDSGDKDKKGNSWYNILLENGWTYRRVFKFAPDWKNKTRGFIATFKLDKNGKRTDEQPKLSSPDESSWGLRKIKTENDIQKSGKTVGEFIYNIVLQNPDQKIIGETVRTIDRKYYRDEVTRILDKQREFIPELSDNNLYQQCIEALYPSNDAHRRNISRRGFTYLFTDDILFYQRPLKTKKGLIADCPYEERHGKPIKCIAKSHPMFHLSPGCRRHYPIPSRQQSLR